MKNYKKGVSLVTVLLFMLVATIAATATYKWLSSAGLSSTSRLEMNEARQAAVSGIDATRSWIIYNANDVGDAVRQFFENQKNGSGKFVKLNKVLPRLANNKHKYDVFLVGVDKSHSTYKMKIISIGVSRNGDSKYSESAILNVSGLYQVKIPEKKEVKPANFKDAFHAGPTGGTSIDVSSGVVNGDISINTASTVEDYLVVTGTMNVNSNTHVNDLYVHKKLLVCTNLNVAGNAYINEELYVNGVAVYQGNLYAGHGLDMTGSGKPAGEAQCGTGSGNGLRVGKNLTVDGNLKMPSHTAGANPGNGTGVYQVDGNLVVKNGEMQFTPGEKTSDGGTAINEPWQANFLGNVFVENGLTGNHFYYSNANHVVLGSPQKKVFTGTGPLYQVSNDKGTPGHGEIVYPFWLSNKTDDDIYISKDGKYLSEENNWNDRLNPFSWKGKMDPIPKNTYCNSDKCAPTFNATINFWQVGQIYGVTTNRGIQGYYSCSTENPDNKNCVYNPWYYHCTCGGNNYTYAKFRGDAFVQVNGSYESSLPDTTGWGAERLQAYADAIKPAEGNCKQDHIPDPIQFNKALLDDPKMYSAENSGSCKNVGIANEWYTDPSLWKVNNNERWHLLDDCYNLAQTEGRLYKDEWLLLHFVGGQQFAVVNDVIGSGTKLTKKYIMVFDEPATISLPETTPDAMVLIYLAKGGVISMKGDNTQTRNIFIYSDGDITDYNNNSNQLTVHGSIYLADCHTMHSTNMIKVQFNEVLTSALEDIGAICGNDGTDDCTSSGGGSGGAGGSSGNDESLDTYYVASAPQLGVTLETQHKNDEISINNLLGNEIAASAIVLPRIVYLYGDAEGKLSDYYSVVPLNKMKQSELANGSMVCPAEISTSGKLYNGTHFIKKGNYTCHYKTGISEIDGNEGIPLYVVVSNPKGAAPTISLEAESKEIVDNKAVVKLLAEAGDRQISFQVSAPSLSYLPHDWSYVAKNGGTKIEDNGIYAVYEFPPMTPDGNPIDLFEITTTASAAQGDAIFFLDQCESCNIGVPRQERVYITGSAKVKRIPIDNTYCNSSTDGSSNAETFKDFFGVECSDVAELQDCDLSILGRTGENWISIHGQNCQPPTSNDEWQCNTGEDIYLTAQNWARLNDYCTAYVPEQRINPELNGEYELPASFKRKAYTQKIEFEGEGDRRVTVKYHRASEHSIGEFATLKTCTSNCEVILYAGDIIHLSTESEDFSYWYCVGDDCKDSEEKPNNTDYFQMEITTENTIKAYFSQKDTHCDFDDFSKTKAFCSNSTSNKCIDKCASGSHCSVTDGNYTESDWIMVYANSNCTEFSKALITGAVIGCAPFKQHSSYDVFTAPIINNSEGSIIAPNDGLSNSLKSTVLLNRIEAGYNGVLTTTFEVPLAADNLFDKLINSPINDAFIIRSNADASQYLSLSVIPGLISKGKLCYVTGQENTNSAPCLTGNFKTPHGLNAVITRATPISMTTTVLEKKVTAEISYMVGGGSYGSATLEFDLSTGALMDHALNDDVHQYVGFKMSAPAILEGAFQMSLKVHDFTWKTSIEEYEKTCFSAPSLYCSFKSNYTGGFVPKDQDVTPLVSKSSWLATKNCSVAYYYNGCDMPSDKYKSGTTILHWVADKLACGDGSGMGYTSYDATMLETFNIGQLRSDIYRFTTEGPHGTPVSGGYSNDASVMLMCDGKPTTYKAHCGTFNVGRKESCSRSYTELLASDYDEYCSGDESCSPDLIITDPINLRDARINLTIDELTPGEGDIVVYLQSEGGLSKPAVVIENSGTYNFNVSGTILDGSGFNPQEVIGFVFVRRGPSSYKVTHIGSTCVNSMTFTECSEPVYDFSKKEWAVSAKIENLDPEAKCEIIGLGHAYGANKSATDCATTFTQTIKQEDVSGQNEDRQYTFQIVAKIGDETVGSCEASKTILAHAGTPTPPPPGQAGPVSVSGCDGTVSNIEGYFAVTPTVYGCDNGCTVTASRGSVSPSSNYTSGEITVSGITSAGQVEVTLSNGTPQSGVCRINVESVKPTLNVECPRGPNPGKTINTDVTVRPHLVDGCNNDCSYEIVRKESHSNVGSGSGYNGGDITFKDASAIAGPNTYTLTVSKGSTSSTPCDFTVSYNDTPTPPAGSATDLIIEYSDKQDEFTSIPSGTYDVYTTNQWSGHLRCKADKNVNITVDGNPVTITTSPEVIAKPRTNVKATLAIPEGESINCQVIW